MLTTPSVNAVFNPEYVDCLFPKPPRARSSLLSEARATNYGVVRLALIEQLYERMYDQKRALGPDERRWPHRILGGRAVARVDARADGVALTLRPGNAAAGETPAADETLEADVVIAATGYRRTAHVDLLRPAWPLLPPPPPDDGHGVSGWTVDTDRGPRHLAVGRDYRVRFAPDAVAAGSGVWLQGCCEGTHGLSDTLLSVLGPRSGELVESIFGHSD